MKKLNYNHLILAAGLGCLATAQGATLQIDFSTIAGAQAGWETLGAGAPTTLVGGDTTQSGVFSGYTELSAGNVTVTVTNLEFNRRQDNGGANDNIFNTDLDAMYGDMLLRNDGALNVNVAISGLLAGTYSITTHHLQQPNTPSQFDLILTDDLGTNTIGNYAMGSGDTTAFNPTIITFDVVSNGTDDIVLVMDETFAGSGGNTGGWLGINGMEIAVPEPSSMGLLGLGSLLLFARRRR